MNGFVTNEFIHPLFFFMCTWITFVLSSWNYLGICPGGGCDVPGADGKPPDLKGSITIPPPLQIEHIIITQGLMPEV